MSFHIRFQVARFDPGYREGVVFLLPVCIPPIRLEPVVIFIRTSAVLDGISFRSQVLNGRQRGCWTTIEIENRILIRGIPVGFSDVTETSRVNR